MRLLKKQNLIAIVLIILLSINILYLNLSLYNIKAQEIGVIPSNIDDIDSITYKMTENLNHWSEGQYNGEGNISIDLDHQVSGLIYFDIDYNMTIWQKPCDTYVEINDKVYYEVNSSNRQILAMPDKFLGISYTGYHINWYLGKYFEDVSEVPFYFEELMNLYGEKYEKNFTMIGEKTIFVGGERIDTNMIEWVGQFLYAGYICSIGNGPLFNCSVNYYYEKNSGLLVYSEVQLHIYLGSTPSIYQDILMTKYLIDVNGETVNVNGTNSENDEDGANWPWEGENKEEFLTFIIIGSIIVGGILAMFLINKHSKKILTKNLLELERDLGSIDEIPENSNEKKND